jgi:hypothetical protein
MKLRKLTGAIALLFAILGMAGIAAAQKPGYRISEPFTYQNLTIFLIHGKDQITKGNILTLQEAMERDILIVYETSDVNTLAVENVSKEFQVFIQSGDIVKGGKQDRVLAVSILIPAMSGRIEIDAFCVESGRWTKRGTEDVSKFNSSNDRIVSKDLKIAANKTKSQQEVWAKVGETQDKLSSNVGGTVNSAASKSSLQLSLENKKVTATVDEYIKNLNSAITGKSDVIGYAFAINGEINSADVYVSNALFKKLWPKMLKASAVEAVADLDGKSRIYPASPKPASVTTFMADSEKGKAEEKRGPGRTKVTTRESKENVVFEARDEKTDVVVHTSYVKIQ